jgi:outer membrane lipoprotein-sorting protein
MKKIFAFVMFSFVLAGCQQKAASDAAAPEDGVKKAYNNMDGSRLKP